MAEIENALALPRPSLIWTNQVGRNTGNVGTSTHEAYLLSRTSGFPPPIPGELALLGIA